MGKRYKNAPGFRKVRTVRRNADGTTTPTTVWRKQTIDMITVGREGEGDNEYATPAFDVTFPGVVSPYELLSTVGDMTTEVQHREASTTKNADLLTALSYSNDVETVRRVAGNPAIPFAVAERLVNHSSVEVVEAAAGNPVYMSKCDVEDIVSRGAGKRKPGRRDVAAKRGVAGNVSTPKHVLVSLAGDGNYTVRAAVAGNSRCPRKTVRMLASDRSVKVRVAVAAREHLPADVEELVMGDRSWEVRAARARYGDLTGKLLTLVLRDKNPRVAAAMLDRDVLPGFAAERMLYGGGAAGWRGRSRVAGKVSVTGVSYDDAAVRKVLMYLAEDEYAAVRLAAVGNVNCPFGVARRKMFDVNRDVRAAARRTMLGAVRKKFAKS